MIVEPGDPGAFEVDCCRVDLLDRASFRGSARALRVLWNFPPILIFSPLKHSKDST